MIELIMVVPGRVMSMPFAVAVFAMPAGPGLVCHGGDEVKAQATFSARFALHDQA
jgi:hypothetical protein